MSSPRASGEKKGTIVRRDMGEKRGNRASFAGNVRWPLSYPTADAAGPFLPSVEGRGRKANVSWSLT